MGRRVAEDFFFAYCAFAKRGGAIAPDGKLRYGLVHREDTKKSDCKSWWFVNSFKESRYILQSIGAEL